MTELTNEFEAHSIINSTNCYQTILVGMVNTYGIVLSLSRFAFGRGIELLKFCIKMMNYWLLMFYCYIWLYNAPIPVAASVAGILEICIVVFNLRNEVDDAVDCQLMQHLLYIALAVSAIQGLLTLGAIMVMKKLMVQASWIIIIIVIILQLYSFLLDLHLSHELYNLIWLYHRVDKRCAVGIACLTRML